MTAMRRVLPAVWALLTIAIVGTVVWFGLDKVRRDPPRAAGDVAVPVATGPAFLKPGNDYYVLVKLIEFDPRKPNGSYWDRGTNTTPDPKVRLFWHGQEIFTLPTRDDQFIATWDLFRVNLKDVAMTGGNVDIASSINAPIIRVEAGKSLRIEAYDSDLTYDDPAMKTEVRLDELVEGDNDIPPPRGSGVRRLIVQAIDRHTSLADLVALASKR